MDIGQLVVERDTLVVFIDRMLEEDDREGIPLALARVLQIEDILEDQNIPVHKWENRRYLVHPINQLRDVHGDFATLVQELKQDDDSFFHYCRMDVRTFNVLLAMVTPHLTGRAHHALEPELKLVLTLR